MTTTLCQGRSRSECRACVDQRNQRDERLDGSLLCLLDREVHFLAHLPYEQWRELDLPLKEWSRSSVLDADTETLLFQQLNLSFFLASRERGIANAATGLPADLDECRRHLERGEAIRNTLALVFHKLVISIARHYSNDRVSLDELASEGQIVLLRAIQGFDPELGFRFSTYATHAIRRRLLNYLRSAKKRQVEVDCWSGRDVLPDERRWTAVYERRVAATMTEVERLARRLTSRERYVLRARFGWGREFETRTLQQIADEFGLSRERVRQIEAHALKKLRRLAEDEGLEGI